MAFIQINPDIKKPVVSIAMLVVLLLFLYMAYSFFQNRREIKAKDNLIAALNDSTRHWKNKFGEEVASRRIAEASLKELKQHVNLDSVARSFDTRAKRLEGYYKLIQTGIAQLRTAGEPVIALEGDSVVQQTLAELYRKVEELGQPCPPKIRYMEQEFSSQYYSLKARIGDSAYAVVRTTDTLAIISQRAFRRHFLRREWYTELSVKSANPDARYEIAGAYSIKDVDRRRWLELNAQAGLEGERVQYSPRLFVGGDVQYHFGRASVFGEYRASPLKLGNGMINTGVRYTLLKF